MFNERLVTYYGNEPSEMAVFWRTQRESFAPLYWTMVCVNFVLPLVIMGIKRFRTITGCVIASLGVVVGMWLERFLIIVPSLGHKYLPYSYGIYRPQPVEIIIAVVFDGNASTLFGMVNDHACSEASREKILQVLDSGRERRFV